MFFSSKTVLCMLFITKKLLLYKSCAWELAVGPILNLKIKYVIIQDSSVIMLIFITNSKAIVCY